METTVAVACGVQQSRDERGGAQGEDRVDARRRSESPRPRSRAEPCGAPALDDGDGLARRTRGARLGHPRTSSTDVRGEHGADGAAREYLAQASAERVASSAADGVAADVRACGERLRGTAGATRPRARRSAAPPNRRRTSPPARTNRSSRGSPGATGPRSASSRAASSRRTRCLSSATPGSVFA